MPLHTTRIKRTMPSRTSHKGKYSLISYHRYPLHLFHSFLLLLTTLLILLEGSSGPGSGYWWIDLKYTDGGSWLLGGLGACEKGIRSVCNR
ncbi:hypothetical protein BD324DRAFT_611864 [Kockovaella imperatae]|uniref:Uncharacterized protein n=1 Tax=Kockovaella imperatae TaxID=4999 RepID=A0A1Y1URX3_9TREE|nr:hypothetical protein BD324DRAFT_611864 [Kockovaella imperatae]ORX40719.1 hypothetical protein BD324DRAFT_611864 [Kockovaella imperatae]